MRKFNIISACLWLVLAILIGVESLRIGIGRFRNPDAGLFPLLTAILLGIFSLWLLFDSTLRPKSQKEKDKGVWAEGTKWANILFTLLALAIYALILDKIGYLITTFLFILFLFRVIEPLKWRTAILGAALTVLLSYTLFQVWLQTQLPDGVIIEWLKKIYEPG